MELGTATGRLLSAGAIELVEAEHRGVRLVRYTDIEPLLAGGGRAMGIQAFGETPAAELATRS